MTLRLKIELIAGLILLLGAAFGAKVWLDEHDSRIKAEASVAAQQQLQQQYQAQVSDLAKRLEQRDALFQSQLQSLNGRFAQANNPDQIASLATQLVGLKQPVQIVTPPPTIDMPHPSPVAEVQTSDAPAVKAYLQECEQCKLDRAKLQADAVDRQSQAHLKELQIDSLKKENLSLTQAVKGGSFFQRLGKATKYLVLGGAGAVVAVCGTGHCR